MKRVKQTNTIVFQSEQVTKINIAGRVNIILDTHVYNEITQKKYIFKLNSKKMVFVKIPKGDKQELMNYVMKTKNRAYHFIDKKYDFRIKNIRSGENRPNVTAIFFNDYIKWIGDTFWFLTDLQDYDTFKNSLLIKSGNDNKNHLKYYIAKVTQHNPQISILIHRVVLDYYEQSTTVYVDHINRVRQDNRRKNLRIVSASDNSLNKRGVNNKTKGIFFVKGVNKWRAQVTYQRKTISLGYFTNAIDAQKAYNNAALKLSPAAYVPKIE